MDFSLWRVGRAELAGGGGRVVDAFLARRAEARAGTAAGEPEVCLLERYAPQLNALFSPPPEEPGAGELVVYGGDLLYEDPTRAVVVTGLPQRTVPHVAEHLAGVNLNGAPEAAELSSRAEEIRRLYRCAARDGQAVLKVAMY